MYISSLFRAKQCHNADRAPCHSRVGEDKFDFVYNGLRFSGVHVAIPAASLDKHIDQRRIEAFVRVRQAEWLDITFIELAV